MQASKMASAGPLPSLRSAWSAKSIIMMAFFLTMPMSSTMPMMEMTLRSSSKSVERQHRAHARRGQRRDDGDRMDQAFVQDSENDVHGHQRRDDEDGLRGKRRLVGQQGPGVKSPQRGRRAELGLHVANAFGSVAQGGAGSEVEGGRDRGEQPRVVDRQRDGAGAARGHGGKRDVRPVRSRQVNVVQIPPAWRRTAVPPPARCNTGSTACR